MRPKEETSNSPCVLVSGLILLRRMWLTGAAFAFSALAGAPSPAAAAPTYQHLMSFGKSSAYPQSGLTEGADGALYGTASGGGDGYGTVFKLNPDGSGFTV